MRVLVATTAGAGHFGPMVPFARACQDAGWDVLVAAPTSFEAAVTSVGLAHGAVPDPPADEIAAVFGRLPGLSLEEANAVVIREVFCGVDARAALPGLQALVDQWRPDVILRESAEFASYVVAESRRIPQVHVAIGLESFLDLAFRLVDEPLRALGASGGLDGLFSSPRVSLAPAVLEDPTTSLESEAGRYRDDTAPAGVADLPEWWGGRADPLVYATFGSTAAVAQMFPDLHRAAALAVAELPVRVLMTVGTSCDPSELGPLPSNVHVEQWYPQAAVLAHAAAMVGHGGWGTTMGGLEAAVPMVVLPLFALDQHHNARRVEAVGAGLALSGGAASIESLPGAVRRVLDPSFKAAATRISQEIQALTPASRFPAALTELRNGRSVHRPGPPWE